MIHRQHPFFLTWLGRHTYLLNKFLLSYGLLYDTFHFSSSDNSWSHRVSLLVVSQCSTRSCGKALIPSIFSHTRPCFSQKWPWAFHHRCPYLSLADTQGRYLAKFKGELSNALRYLDTGSLHMCLNPDRSLYTEGELVQRCYLKFCNPCRDKMKKEKNLPTATCSCFGGLHHKIVNMCSKSPILSNWVLLLGEFERFVIIHIHHLNTALIWWDFNVRRFFTRLSFFTWAVLVLTVLSLLRLAWTFPRHVHYSQVWIGARVDKVVLLLAFSFSALFSSATRFGAGAPRAPHCPSCWPWGILKGNFFWYLAIFLHWWCALNSSHISLLGKPTRKKSAVVFNIVQKAFDPHPPLHGFEHMPP